MGIRTNNPGNIVKSEVNWVGEVPCPEEKLNECFVSPYYGIRALAKVLHTYIHNHGLDTIDTVMARYSEFEGAAVGVSRISGIPLDAPLYTWDKDVMLRLMHGIVVQENGYNPYHLEFLEEVLDDTYGADHFISQYGNWRGAEVDRSQAAVRGGQTQTDDGGAHGTNSRALGYSEQRQATVPVDSQIYSCICRAFYHSPTEAGRT